MKSVFACLLAVILAGCADSLVVTPEVTDAQLRAAYPDVSNLSNRGVYAQSVASLDVDRIRRVTDSLRGNLPRNPDGSINETAVRVALGLPAEPLVDWRTFRPLALRADTNDLRDPKMRAWAVYFQRLFRYIELKEAGDPRADDDELPARPAY